MNVILETQKAVYAKLTGDATLMGMVKGVYDHVPDGAEYPYVTIGDSTASNNSAVGLESYKLDLNLNIYSKNKGRKEVWSIADQLKKLLTTEKLYIEGMDHRLSRFINLTSSLRSDGATYKANINFRFIVNVA